MFDQRNRSLLKSAAIGCAVLFTSSLGFAGISTSPATENRITALIKKMTLEEKVTMVGGNDFDTQPIPRLGIPSIRTTDGPLGVRNGKMTAFPSGLSLGSSFDPELTREVADAIGEETRFIGRNMLLGPCVNISRQPFGGRNFESFGEDPFLTSRMAESYVHGIQGQNVLASTKHFAVNDQEVERMTINVMVDLRTLFEIHLPAFKAAVDAGTWTVMDAYNKINGQFGSENWYLNTFILKGKWNFQGVLVSDWGGTHSTGDAANNGLDLEMPFPDFFGAKLLALVKTGEVPEAVLDDKVRRLLRAMYGIGLMQPSDAPDLPAPKGPSSDEHQAVALKAARESIVLLKNENSLLPLGPKIHSLAVLGPNASRARTGGGGSSHVDPFLEVSPLDGIQARFGGTLQIQFAPGVNILTEEDAVAKGLDPAEKLAQAVALAKASDAAVIFVGVSEWLEGEGGDRTTLELPDGQADLIRAVGVVNSNVIVVMTGGGPFLTSSWISSAKAVLDNWYPGEEGGTAIADVLSGNVNPSAKLPVTFLKRWEDSPAYGHYPGQNFGPAVVNYEETIYVGYRHFDTKGIAPDFEFGHGLSYTSFGYKNLDLQIMNASSGSPRVHLVFDLQNTGAVAGAEVAQVYIGEEKPVVDRPLRELKGFKRVLLQPGQTSHVELDLDASSFAYFDTSTMEWKVNPGTFKIEVGSSSRDIRLTSEVAITK